MKLQPDRADVQTLTGHGPGWIAVNGERLHSSTIVGSRNERLAWPCAHFDQLTPAHFAQLSELGAEIILFGSGEQLRFPRPDWIAPLIARQLGVETMSTAAACRTYNILAAEGRHVLAALLIESPPMASGH